MRRGENITNGIGTFNTYCGEYTDKETGNIYLRARYYDPGVGRFLSQDPYWTPRNRIYGSQEDVQNPNIEAIRQSVNLYAYCWNNPVMFVDPTGEDAVIVTSSEAANRAGHTSAIYQDENGEWFYTYWGDKAAAVIHVPSEQMKSLSDFSMWLSTYLEKNGFERITSNYDSATYVVGDFTDSLNTAYADVNSAYTLLGNSSITRFSDGSVVFQGWNTAYNLVFVNCIEKTNTSFKLGKLANSMNVGEYMKALGFTGGVIPNKATSKYSEMFMNSSFTYSDAKSSLYNYAKLYFQGSPWATRWEKANYAKYAVK